MSVDGIYKTISLFVILIIGSLMTMSMDELKTDLQKYSECRYIVSVSYTHLTLPTKLEV